MIEFITLNPHLQEIISNIKTELDLQDQLLVTDEIGFYKKSIKNTKPN